MDVLYKMKREMFRRGYSVMTIKTYVYCVEKFLNKNHKDIRKYSKKDIREFLYYLKDKGLSGNTLNVYLNALKFMMEQILRKRCHVDIKFSKTPKRLPVVLTKEEIVRLIRAIDNEKHSLLVKLIYSAGLRISELVNLKIRDLEFKYDYGWVREGKGNKDRLFIISKKLKPELLEFIKNEGLKEGDYFFEGRRNNHLSRRTVQAIIDSARKKAGIKKRVHPHTLRHSFSTHLIENGCSVADVQNLLGHNSPETTMVYVHMQKPKMIKVKSPYDTL